MSIKLQHSSATILNTAAVGGKGEPSTGAEGVNSSKSLGLGRALPDIKVQGWNALTLQGPDIKA